jgi:hypothetical protein
LYIAISFLLLAQPSLWPPLIRIIARYVLVSMNRPRIHRHSRATGKILSNDGDAGIGDNVLKLEGNRRIDPTHFLDAGV